MHRFYQMWQQLDCDVARPHAAIRAAARPTCSPGSRRPSPPAATASGPTPQSASQGRRHRDGLLQRRQGRRALSDRAGPRIHPQRQLPSAGDGRNLRQPDDVRLRRRALLRRRQRRSGDARPRSGSGLEPAGLSSTRSRTPIRCAGTNNWYTKTAMAAAATPTAPTYRSRASLRSSITSARSTCRRTARPTRTICSTTMFRPSSAAARPTRSTTVRSPCRR